GHASSSNSSNSNTTHHSSHFSFSRWTSFLRQNGSQATLSETPTSASQEPDEPVAPSQNNNNNNTPQDTKLTIPYGTPRLATPTITNDTVFTPRTPQNTLHETPAGLPTPTTRSKERSRQAPHSLIQDSETFYISTSHPLHNHYKLSRPLP